MTLEYLFVGSQNKDELYNYTPSSTKISKSINDIENSDCWTVSFQTIGNALNDANLLSGIHDQIVEKYHPIVITNESSAYYNKTLFPLYNDFERKLRKMLYLKSALAPSVDNNKNIENLESQDLGSIFEMLFTDTNFISCAKQKVNEKSWKYTKEEILKTIEKIQEDVLWDRLVGSICVPTLRNNFFAVKQYRNDTMHAHNINSTLFNKSKKLITQINNELDAEIGHIIGRTEDTRQTEMDKQFNEGMTAALNSLLNCYKSDEYQKQLSTIRENWLTSIKNILSMLGETGEDEDEKSSDQYEGE